LLSIDPAETLLTMAEVAVAFAGFASLIAILGMRQAAAAFDLLRYWVMLEFSLAALGFALLPQVLGAIGVGEAVVWRSVSALLALFTIVHNLVLAVLYVRGIEAVRAAAGQANLLAANAVYAAIILSQLGNAFGWLDHLAGWYVFGLFLVLVVASAHFTLFIGHAIAHLRGGPTSGPNED
jgi:hypothetical protein